MDTVPKHMLDATQPIDFGCRFVGGECEGVRKRSNRNLKNVGRLCCRNCHHYAGYLRVKERDLPEEYRPYFTFPEGFLGEDGCRLPREMRSRRCIIYVCRDSLISDDNRAMLVKFEGES